MYTRMHFWTTIFAICAAVSLATGHSTTADEDAGKAADGKTKHLLRYQFETGETIRWKTTHLAKIRMTIADSASLGDTQTTETLSRSTKIWRVKEVHDDGSAVFEHIVDDLDMCQRTTGRQEIRYTSESGETPPPEFAEAAETAGKVLTVFTLDNRGFVVDRETKTPNAGDENQGHITIPLPEEPIAIGDTWSEPHEIILPRAGGTVQRIRSRQKFTFEEFDDGIAKLKVQTQILTPINDPKLEVQLIQRYTNGTALFDVERGRLLRQQMDLDKTVVGFHGTASSLHYRTQFTEELVHESSDSATETAERDGDTAVE